MDCQNDEEDPRLKFDQMMLSICRGLLEKAGMTIQLCTFTWLVRDPNFSMKMEI